MTDMSHITRMANITQYKSSVTYTDTQYVTLTHIVSKMQTFHKPLNSAQNFQAVFARMSADGRAYVCVKGILAGIN
jgi:hypothetical protein